MGTKKILFIEGGSETTNGDLRQGFSKLFEKLVPGHLPKIILGNGKSQAIQKFLKNQQHGVALLLVDLDGADETKEADLQKNGLLLEIDKVFYMIQEMETWFIAQPEVLNDYFGIDDQTKKQVSDKLPKRRPIEIPNPKEVLKTATKESKRGKYHEIKHGVELLKRLEVGKLAEEFDDFRHLLARLKEES